jgi:hypothetical protein
MGRNAPSLGMNRTGTNIVPVRLQLLRFGTRCTKGLFVILNIGQHIVNLLR